MSAPVAEKVTKDSNSDKGVGYLKRLLERDPKTAHTKKSKKSKKTKRKKKGKHKKKKKHRRSTSDSDTEATDSASDDEMRSSADSGDEWVEKPVDVAAKSKDRTMSSQPGVSVSFKEDPVHYTSKASVFKEDEATSRDAHFVLPSSFKEDNKHLERSSLETDCIINNAQERNHPIGTTSTSSTASLSNKLRHFSEEEMHIVAELLRRGSKTAD